MLSRAPRRYRLDALPQLPENERVFEPVRVEKSGARARTHAACFAVALVAQLAARNAAAEPPAAVPALAPVSAPAPTRAPTVPLLAFVFGAIGLSGISVGGTTGFLALNQKAIVEDNCSPTVRVCNGRGRAANETGRALRDISTAGFIVGGLGLGLSAYVLLTAPAQNGDLAVAVVADGGPPQAALVAHF